MKKIVAAVLLGILILSGCGSQISEDTLGVELYEESRGAQGNTQEESNGNEGEAGAEIDVADEIEAGTADAISPVFSTLPDSFILSSGAGGWATELYLQDDGTFVGTYHDSDMGYVGEGYPNGTMYVSNFSGKFSEPQVVNEYTYSTSIEYLELEKQAGQEEVVDGVRYVYCGASGLSDAGEILIFLPGAGYSDLPADFMSWMQQGDLGPEDLRCYGIYNVNETSAFRGYNYADFSELSKLTGSYLNANGDALSLTIYSEWDGLSNEIGTCTWTPQGGETLNGFVHRDVKGGFKINLPESMEYSFEITNSTEGNIEFSGEGFSAQLGSFEMME